MVEGWMMKGWMMKGVDQNTLKDAGATSRGTFACAIKPALGANNFTIL